MAATAQKSYGTTVVGSTVGAIGGLTGCSVSGVEVNTIPTTAWDSGGWATYIGGVKDGGTIEVTGRCDPSDTGQSGIISNLGSTDSLTITLTSGAKIEAGVIVTGYNPSAGEDDAVEFTASFKVSGAITITAGGGG